MSAACRHYCGVRVIARMRTLQLYIDGVRAEHALWYIISWCRPRGSSKPVSGVPGHNPVFRYNPGNSGMVGTGFKNNLGRSGRSGFPRLEMHTATPQRRSDMCVILRNRMQFMLIQQTGLLRECMVVFRDMSEQTQEEVINWYSLNIRRSPSL